MAKDCDVDKIMQQVKLLDHLRELSFDLKEEHKRLAFPDFTEMDLKIKHRIEGEEAKLAKILKSCGIEYGIYEESEFTEEELKDSL